MAAEKKATAKAKQAKKKLAAMKTPVKEKAAKSTRVEKQSGKKSGKPGSTTGPKRERVIRAASSVAAVGTREVRDEGVPVEAGQGDAQASLRAAQQEDGELQQGADLTRLITQAFSEAMRPVIEGQASLQAAVDAFGQRIASIEKRLPSGEPSQVPPAQTPAAATPATRARLAVIQGWREQLWYTECGERARMKLPRPTIIGRVLYDLSATKRDHDVTVPDVFNEIAKTGPHHLASSCQRDLALLASGSKKDRDDASSRLTKRYRDRFEWLERQSLAESEKPDGLWRRWLSDRGLHVFDAWPDWEVSDEAGPEGHGRHQAEAVTGMNTEAAAGGSDGGNRSGSGGLNSSTASQPSLLRPGGSGQP